MASIRMAASRKAAEGKGQLSFTNALDDLRSIDKKHPVKFAQTVEMAMVLSIDSRSSSVRGSVAVPYSLGKEVKICCFTNNEDPKSIEALGADAAGGQDMIDEIINGKQKCDMLITFKNEMPKIGKFGRQLGGKGLMPNPKDGTIAEDLKQLEKIIKDAKLGVAQFKNDKAGIVHVGIGKISSSNEELIANIKAIVSEVKRLKPAKAKGKYIKKLYLTTTMGPSFAVSPSEVE